MNERDGDNQFKINEDTARKVNSNTKKLVLGAIFAGAAALFQSAGILVGIGYAFSILTTLPIVLSMLLSFRIGFMSYIITILLLLIIQPSELWVFPFTTGLLGVSLGAALRCWKNWLVITLFSGVGLATGILFLLYILRFPVLGPTVSNVFDLKISLMILLFSLFYSWVWMVVSRRMAGIFNITLKF
jgi:hypothetical protein